MAKFTVYLEDEPEFAQQIESHSQRGAVRQFIYDQLSTDDLHETCVFVVIELGEDGQPAYDPLRIEARYTLNFTELL